MSMVVVNTFDKEEWGRGNKQGIGPLAPEDRPRQQRILDRY